ncbi:MULTISPECIES: ABC transporter permease [Burkholderia]|uniref:ABC transporter permease n=1 Tax=Burkholderia TaxID=32008 RepID=UPI00084213E0|nr:MULTISPECIES: ABC transporter permease [unclassified Burkholderia]AOK29778.1 ABC transporter permease [Burkholderia sp. Bp7605]
MTNRTAGAGGLPAPAPAPDGARAPRIRIDKVGVLIAALVAIAAFAEPFVTWRANRIVAGKALALGAVFPAPAGYALAALWAAGAAFALVRSPPAWRAAAGGALIVVLCIALGAAPAYLVTSDTPLARVSPAAGAWLLLFAFAVLIADALARVALPPGKRLAALGAAVAASAAFVLSGAWDGLSVMQEYAVRADTFRNEAIRHLELVAGSVAAAIAFGVPLGIGCVRSATLQRALLPLLNVVQTIPSIALYGLLMAPLALVAAHVPLAARLGVSGIGVTPALIALFLYALLPIVSSVVVGIAQVPPAVVEAARAMGMTDRERLVSIELPLALPVMLSGVRIVLVQNIGLAAVAALIGGGGFGTFIFQGIGQSATDLVLLGTLPTIALALVSAVLFEAMTELAKGARR